MNPKHRCKCGCVFEAPEDRKEFQFAPCPDCSELANRIVDKPPSFFVKGKFDAYESPITGEVITSARQRNNEMKEHGCVDYEPSIKDEADRRVKEDERKLDKLVDETVDHEISVMEPRKREKLFEELKSGADINVERL